MQIICFIYVQYTACIYDSYMQGIPGGQVCPRNRYTSEGEIMYNVGDPCGDRAASIEALKSTDIYI